MTPASPHHSPDRSPLEGRIVADALLAGVVTLLLTGPLLGLVLDGYQVQHHWDRPLWSGLAVFLGRLAVGIWAATPLGRHWLARLAGRGGAGVYVARHHRRHHLLVAGAVALAFLLPFLLSSYWLNVAILCLIYVLLGLGLNIVVGLAGLLDLGFVAFYAVGAYGYALGHLYLGLDFWAALPLGAALAAAFGAVLGFPVLRMHGDYLAIVTLGFGEIIRLVLNNWTTFTGGPNGVRVPFPSIMGVEFTRRATQGGTPFHQFMGWDYSSHYRYLFLYLLLLAMVCLMVLFVTRLKGMPLGRAWEALREDEIACRALGINHVVVKLSAFSMGAMVGGIGGVFFAAYQGFVNPSSFTFFESALILAVVVLGGMGSTVGVIAAAVVLTALPEVLREFADYRVLAFGLAMVMMMVWRPRGLLRIRRPWFAAGEGGP